MFLARNYKNIKRQFTVKPEKAEEFVKEMTKVATPTLHSDFQPELIYLTKENE